MCPYKDPRDKTGKLDTQIRRSLWWDRIEEIFYGTLVYLTQEDDENKKF